MKVVIDKNTRKVLMFELDGVWCSPYELEFVDIDPEEMKSDEEGVYYIDELSR